MLRYIVNFDSLKLSSEEHDKFFLALEQSLLTEVLPDYALGRVKTYELADRFTVLLNRLFVQHNIRLVKNPSYEEIEL